MAATSPSLEQSFVVRTDSIAPCVAMHWWSGWRTSRHISRKRRPRNAISAEEIATPSLATGTTNYIGHRRERTAWALLVAEERVHISPQDDHNNQSAPTPGGTIEFRQFQWTSRWNIKGRRTAEERRRWSANYSEAKVSTVDASGHNEKVWHR